ncbi:MAG: hypothetical protein ACRBN8_36525 [Nannocystales bacterium]
MRRGLFALGTAALVAFIGALVLLETREDPNPPRATTPLARPNDGAREPTEAPTRPPSRDPGKATPPPAGFKLGKASGPDARSNAQAILDNTLVELRRLDTSQQTLARDVYMRGHSAAERVEDELGDDDEPGRAALRAHEDALKAELRRIYGVDEASPRP